MPGRDDTLEDVMDQLCTCGHTLGVHHTLDEACTEDGCMCCAFQRVNPEFGEGQPTEAQLQAQLDAVAHGATARAAGIGDSVRELTADLPGGEGRIGEIKGELDQILDAALLCGDPNCRHRRDRHKHDGCNDCDCPAFLKPKSTEPETLEVPAFLRADARATRNSNTDEGVDRWSNDARARQMDREAMSPTEGMSDEERTESDAVQQETLDNLCTCGHRYGDHAANYGELCLLAACECVKFEALLKPVDLEFVHDSPVDPEAVARAARGPADVQVGNLAETDTLLPDDVRPTDEQVERVLGDNPFRNTRCLKCGHEAEEHAANGTVCHVKGCDCEALVEYTGGTDDLATSGPQFRATWCATCGHPPENHPKHRDECDVEGCECQAFVEHTGAIEPPGSRVDMTVGDVEDVFELPPGTMEKVDPEWKREHAGGINPEDVEAGIFAGLKRYRDDPETDSRKPYTPPLLRKKYIGEAELRKILKDAGRLDLLQEIPEVKVDRVTVNYDAEHWHEIERLARNPQGSSETNTARDRTTKAIAQSLLELRRCLGVSIEHAQMLSVIQRNTAAIQKTVEALDLIVDRVKGEGT